MSATKTIWQTRDGQRIRVKDMSDEHLINTIRMLHSNGAKMKRAHIAAAYSVASGLQGEMAQFYADRDIDRMEATTLEEFLSQSVPTYDALMEEIEKRKLTPFPERVC